jgi:ATP-dependent Clp protease protease subunit
MPEENEEEEDVNNKQPKIAEAITKRFLDERKIFFWGQVDDDSAQKAIAELFYLESKDPGKEIKFYISSPGGSITAGMAVYDTIRMIKSPVTAIVMGMAASMGSILLCAAEKGRRFLFPHSRVVIHQPLIMGRIVAPAVDINIHAAEMEKQRDELNEILAKASGQPLEKIRRDTDRDFYLNAKEAIEYGLADKIITSF